MYRRHYDGEIITGMINLTLPQKISVGDKVMYVNNYETLKCHITGNLFKHIDVSQLVGTVIHVINWQHIAEVEFDDVSILPLALQRQKTWWVPTYKLDTI